MIDGISHREFEEYEELDSARAYEAGLIDAEALFDADSEMTEQPENPSPLNKWDKEMNKRIRSTPLLSEERKLILLDLINEGRKVKPENDRISPADERTLEIAEKAKLEFFNGHLRLAAWFTRESMGFHKKSNFKFGRLATASRLGPGKIHDYAPAPLDYSDRLQVVMESMFKAIDTYDPNKGSFTTIAMLHMENALKRAIDYNSNDSGARIPKAKQEEIRKVKRVVGGAVNSGVQPNLDETVFETGLSHEQVKRIATYLATIKNHLSLERISEVLDEIDTGEEDPVTLADLVRDEVEGSGYDEVLEGAEMTNAYKKLSQNLSKKSLKVIDLRFSLSGTEPMTLEEVGKKFNLKKERIRQIEAKALEVMRDNAVRLGEEPIRSLLDGPVDDTSGIRSGVIRLGDTAISKLNLGEPIIFDTTPGTKSRSTKPKWEYQEDWSD